jgi:hypothetical protein
VFFNAKREEAGAVNQFRKNCTYHGLDVHLSLKALNALKHVIDAKLAGNPADINERDQHTLGRRGLVQVTNDGEVIVTELGLLVAALAEAGSLVTFRAKTKEKAA